MAILKIRVGDFGGRLRLPSFIVWLSVKNGVTLGSSSTVACMCSRASGTCDGSPSPLIVKGGLMRVGR